MEVPDNDLKHVLLLIKFVKEKYHIGQIGNDWYQLHFFGCQYFCIYKNYTPRSQYCSIYSLMIYSLHWNYLISSILPMIMSSATADNIDHLLLTLKHESELAVKWFMGNQMIANPDKFQAMILQILEIQRIMNPLSLKLKVQKLKQKIQLNC